MTADRSGPGCFDEQTIADLEVLGRKVGTDLFTDLGILFVREGKQRLATLDAAVLHGDAPAVARVAHAFFSAAGNLGALELSRLCERLETAARSEDEAAMQRCAALIAAEFARAEAELQARFGLRSALHHARDR